MEKSEKLPELKAFSTTDKSDQLLSPEVTVNQIFHTNPHHGRFIPNCCVDADYFWQKSPCRVGQVNQEFSQPARAVQHKELMQHREPERRGATPDRMDLHHRPLCPAGTGDGAGPANRGTARWGNQPQNGVKFAFASRFIWDSSIFLYIQGGGWTQFSASEWWGGSWSSFAAKIWWWVATLQSLSTSSPLHAQLW